MKQWFKTQTNFQTFYHAERKNVANIFPSDQAYSESKNPQPLGGKKDVQKYLEKYL